ncbi:Hypothetical predicted protein [Paramuricea clavata]|uniref:Uncharacterized protein n=1 Tax=Paramuricea clavata TaxID=317549 RepID=A0A6S7GQ01_PARCT|nr:Hypothetical predicted protein [Paramuricea clavata]
MAALENIGVEYIQSFLSREGSTIKDLSEHLKEQFPNTTGFSTRSIERFCKENDIRRKGVVSDETLDALVEGAVSQVGPVYGRKMMKGYLESQVGTTIASQHRIAKSLQRVNPDYHQRRVHRTERQTNPIPYHADYFGHKLHIDQNEKLVMYGVTHVCAIDGYSRYITAHSTMPIKNNYIIYDQIFSGSWKRILLDTLRTGVFGTLKRKPKERPSSSNRIKKESAIERLWVEVNARVNYPIKNALQSMEADGSIDMDSEEMKFHVSNVSRKLATLGLENVVRSWNYHPIPGVGKPIEVHAANNRAVQIDPQLVPTAAEAGESYEGLGGQLTLFPSFGADPLANYGDRAESREQQFLNQISIQDIMSQLVNGSDLLFRNAIELFANITRNQLT